MCSEVYTYIVLDISSYDFMLRWLVHLTWYHTLVRVLICALRSHMRMDIYCEVYISVFY
jgi:hypothetical protein